MADNMRQKRRYNGIGYCLEGDPQHPVWHITQGELYISPGDEHKHGKTVGMCMHIFWPTSIRRDRPDERSICCECLASERRRREDKLKLARARVGV